MYIPIIVSGLCKHVRTTVLQMTSVDTVMKGTAL